MINLFEISINVLEEFITIMFITLYLGCKYNDIRKYIGFIVTLIISVTMISVMNYFYQYEGILGLSFILIYFMYSLLFLKGNTYIKLFISGFANSIVYFSAMLAIIGTGILFSFTPEKIFSPTAERLLIIFISKVLLITVSLIFLKLKLNYVPKKKHMILLIIMPIIAQISLDGIMQVYFENMQFKNELFLASVSIISATILTYYAFTRIEAEVKIGTEMKTLQQKYEFDREHAQEVKELYTKACSIRHDIINHFVTLNVLIDDNQKAKEYIQSIIGNKLNNTRFFIETGNINFDAIVNTKIALCEKQGIKTYVKTDGSIDILSPDETAVLFGNLFDNAIEASSQTSEKRVELEIGQQDEYISILMKNSIDKSVLDGNEKLKTTKKEKEFHGYGIKNIKKVVSKHKGLISFDEEKGYFICQILLRK